MAGCVVAAGVAWAAGPTADDVVLPGVSLEGGDVGGLTAAALRRRVADVATERAAVRVVAVRGARRVSRAAADVGLRVDVDGTVAQVLRRGRQPNPVAALTDRLRALLGGLDVPVAVAIDGDAVDRWTQSVAETLVEPPVEGGLTVTGTTVTPVYPTAGEVVDRAALAAAARDALRSGRDSTIRVTATRHEPTTTAGDVDVLVAQARRALLDRVDLLRGSVSLRFTPEEIGALLTVERREAPDGSVDLRLAVDADLMAQMVTPGIRAQLETEPRDATYRVTDGRLELVPAQPGFRFDPDAAAAQLLEVATSSGARVAELAGDEVPPGRSTAEVRALGITERVASFTTEHPCCEGRVTNIQRIADLVDGTIIEPGATFSLNAHAGPRTRARGFVPGGAIENGEFVDAVGGGVSQFATTLFNAVFFGGHEIVEFHPHSYYIPRYPPGREATVNWDPPVDLRFTNSSPSGMLIDTSYTATSVTVTLYGTRWVEVDSLTSEPRNRIPPEEIVRTNPDREPGSLTEVQPGRDGFDIEVTRILRFPDGREEREVYATRYLPQPRIVEEGPEGPATSSPSPEPEPTSTATPPPPAGDAPTTTEPTA